MTLGLLLVREADKFVGYLRECFSTTFGRISHFYFNLSYSLQIVLILTILVFGMSCILLDIF